MSSPLEIMMALHFLTRTAPYAVDEPERRHSPSVRRIVHEFLKRGLIERCEPNESGTEYVATDGLRVWCEALCAIRKPQRVERWEIPE